MYDSSGCLLFIECVYDNTDLSILCMLCEIWTYYYYYNFSFSFFALSCCSVFCTSLLKKKIYIACKFYCKFWVGIIKCLKIILLCDLGFNIIIVIFSNVEQVNWVMMWTIWCEHTKDYYVHRILIYLCSEFSIVTYESFKEIFIARSFVLSSKNIVNFC